jgi:hypothetical protein
MYLIIRCLEKLPLFKTIQLVKLYNMLKSRPRFIQTIIVSLLLTFPIILSSCDLIGSIFEAGVWVGILIVVVVIALLIFLFSRFNRRS